MQEVLESGQVGVVDKGVSEGRSYGRARGKWERE